MTSTVAEKGGNTVGVDVTGAQGVALGVGVVVIIACPSCAERDEGRTVTVLQDDVGDGVGVNSGTAVCPAHVVKGHSTNPNKTMKRKRNFFI
jgi:hypothetical protein